MYTVLRCRAVWLHWMYCDVLRCIAYTTRGTQRLRCIDQYSTFLRCIAAERAALKSCCIARRRARRPHAPLLHAARGAAGRLRPLPRHDIGGPLQPDEQGVLAARRCAACRSESCARRQAWRHHRLPQPQRRLQAAHLFGHRRWAWWALRVLVRPGQGARRRPSFHPRLRVTSPLATTGSTGGSSPLARRSQRRLRGVPLPQPSPRGE